MFKYYSVTQKAMSQIGKQNRETANAMNLSSV